MASWWCVSLLFLAGSCAYHVDQEDLHRAKLVHEQGKDFQDGKRIILKGYQTPSQITPAQKRLILDQHNGFRAQAGASNMMKMEWSKDLADLAQGWADECIFGHNNMEFDENHHVGQNTARYPGSGNPDLKVMMGQWQRESKYFDITRNRCRSPGACNHFLVMNYFKAHQVGCGLRHCPHRFDDFRFKDLNAGWIFVCNYAPRISMSDLLYDTQGAPCSSCNLRPGTVCQDGLCSPCPKGSPGCRPHDPSMCEDDYYEKPDHCVYWRDEKNYCVQHPKNTLKVYTWMWNYCPGTCSFNQCDRKFAGGK